MSMLATRARPLLLLSGVVLLSGLLLTVLHMLAIGWGLYAAGYVVSIVAFLGLGASNRERMEAWSWFGMIILLLGLLLGLASIATIWITYADAGFTGAMLMPRDAAPIGLTAELVTWFGLAFYALAARGAGALSGAAALLFVIASIIGLLAAVHVLAAPWWVLAVLLVALCLLWSGVAVAGRRAA